MNGSLRFNGIRKSTAVIAAIAVLTLGFGPGVALADDVGGEDVVIPPPAPAPAPPPPPPPPPVAEDQFTLYLSGIVGYSWAKGNAGGTNRCFICDSDDFPFNGTYKNRGDDWDSTVFGGGALGIGIDLGPVGLRTEIEGQAGRGYDMKTPGPNLHDSAIQDINNELVDVAGPYHISTNSWAMFLNIFLDVPITETLDFYAGGGPGFSVTDMKVTLPHLMTVPPYVERSHDDLKFAWQVGAGFAYDVTDWLTLDLGYRYVDLGQVDVGLNQFPIKGDYELDLTSQDVIFGIRINYYSF